MGSLLATGGSVLSNAAGQETGRAIDLEGAESQARIEGLGREQSQREFTRQTERQQPFIDVGNLALPEFIKAISNRGNASELPATKAQSDVISGFLGDNAPEFIKDEAISNLNATEAERNKGRLADLVSAALGGATSASGSRVNLGTNVSRSLANEGNIRAEGLQQSAINRQNTIGQTVGGLGSLPAYFAAKRK